MNTELKINRIASLEGLKYICENRNIYLYGAGVRASSVTVLLQFRGFSIMGYLVTSMEGNAEKKRGYPVIEANMLQDNKSAVLFAIDVKNIEECYEIVSSEIHEIYRMEDNFYDSEFHNYFKFIFEQSFDKREYAIVDGVVEKNHLLCRCNGLYFRVPPYLLEHRNLKKLKVILKSKSVEKLFQSYYGEFRFLEDESHIERGTHTYSVYMARCHVDKNIKFTEVPDWVIPIQTGASLTKKRICRICDDQGENISEYNRDYSECTAIYWMWKNAPRTDYIGLCHYRRHFDIPKNNIDIIGANNYDIVVTVPTITMGIYQYFRQFVTEEDIDVLKRIVWEDYLEYHKATQNYYDNLFCPPCNMFIMRYEIFQKYAEFAFGVARKIERYYEEKQVVRNDRYMGFLMENLLDIFLIRHKNYYKIGYTNMIFTL